MKGCYMKRIMALSLILIISMACFLMSSCDYDSRKQESDFVLGFSQLGSESGWRIGNSKSIKEAAYEANVDLIFSNAEQKYENQVIDIRRLIANRVDIIAFAPIVNTGWDNVLREAYGAGIPVIITDRGIVVEDESLYSAFVGSDFVLEGEKAAQFLIEYYKDEQRDIKIVELRGTENSTPALGRKSGFENMINRYSKFLIVESLNGDFMKSRGEEIMTGILRKQTEFDVIFSHNDAMTYGVIEALESKGIKPGIDVIIISVDGEQQAIELLKQGKINCVVECTPLIGKEIMEISKKILNGEPVEKNNYSEETVFTMWDDLSELQDRGY